MKDTRKAGNILHLLLRTGQKVRKPLKKSRTSAAFVYKCFYDIFIVCLTGSSFIFGFLPDISCILLQAYPGRYIIYKPQRPATEAYLFHR